MPHSGCQPKLRETQLTSVTELQKVIKKNMHQGLREMFRDLVFVGRVTEDFSLIQHQTKLLLLNTTRLSMELFYQLLIFDFGNFGIMRLSEPARIYDLEVMALDLEESGWSEADGPKENLAKYIVSFLQSKAEMLHDYFCMDIDQVVWDSEKECFESFAQEMSRFYALKKSLFDVGTVISNDEQHEDSMVDKPWKWTTEHVIIPSCCNYFYPQKTFMGNALVFCK